MRKIQKSSFFVILGVVIAVLFLMSISFTQAQGKSKKVKPRPEPEDTWAVQLPAKSENTRIYGDGNTYINNDNDVRIKVEKGSTRFRKGQSAFYYYFSFKLLNPTTNDRYAGFQGVNLIQEEYPDEGPFCVFPEGCGDDPTTCMENFLNQDQPHPEYEYFNLKFQVGQHSFTEGLGYTPEGIEDMTIGIPVKFIGNSDWIKIRVQNQEDFLNPYTEHHNVECDERNYDDDILENMNIWIERLDESDSTYYSNGITTSDGIWRICVGYNYGPGANLLIQEQYTQRTEGKGKKGGSKTVTVVPLEATGNFSFYIDFIKNPTTE